MGQSTRMIYPANQRTFAPAEEILTGIRTQGRWHGERSYQTKDGRIGTRVMTVLRLEDSLGNGQGFLSLHRDVTEERRAALEQEDLRSKMLQTQKLESLGILAGGIAHDFNNLLTGILGNTTNLRDELRRAPEAAESVALIEKAATRAAELCRQMLAFSGRGHFVVKPIDLSEHITSSIELSRASVDKRHTLRLELAPGLPLVKADTAQLSQVLL